MRLVIIADAFPPLRSSGAVQLRDLSLELVEQGHDVTVMVASPELNESWKFEMWNDVKILRLKTLKTKDIGYVYRVIGEFMMPFYMRNNFRKSSLCNQKWDGVIWYSPTIFLGPIVSFLKKACKCRSYLIIRDIFPEWALDIGLIGRGLPYYFLKIIANYQYSIADVIGIQTPGNRRYFANWVDRSHRQIEVLHNWLADTSVSYCSISVSKTALIGRKIFVYAGNMGVAQGVSIFLELAAEMKERSDIGFLFVGRGSDVQKLRAEASLRNLNNIVFFDEIEPREIPGLYAQCKIGLVALDPRHRSHNIPGKFLSYMQAGLPVLASVNYGNDIVRLIETENLGRVCTNASVQTLKILAEQLIDNLESDLDIAVRCRSLSLRLFSPNVAVRQIVGALKNTISFD